MLTQAYGGGGFTKVGHYLQGQRLELLKQLWRAYLLKFAAKHGVAVSSLQGEALPVVYFQYLDWFDQARVIHKFQYVNRRPLEDYAIYSNDNLGCADPADWLVDYRNRVRVYGWFRQLSKILGKETCADIKQDQSRLCPLCGDPLCLVGSLVGDEVRRVYNRGSPLYSLEWRRGHLHNVPLSASDIDFICSRSSI